MRTGIGDDGSEPSSEESCVMHYDDTNAAIEQKRQVFRVLFHTYPFQIFMYRSIFFHLL